MKVKLGLATLDFDGVANLGDTIHSAMTANAATFDHPDPTMAALAADIADVRAKILAREAADTAAQNALQALYAADRKLRDALTAEAGYVDAKAKGDAAIITLAGMGVRKTPAPVGPMPKVLDVKVSISDYPGEVDVMWPPIPGALAYIVQTCAGDPNVEANWHYADTFVKSSDTLKNLPRGAVIWLRVCAKGADATPGPWSDPAQEIVR